MRRRQSYNRFIGSRRSPSASNIWLPRSASELYHTLSGRINRLRFLLRQKSKRVYRQPFMTTLTRGQAPAHITRIAAPAAIGLFCNTLFNITDTFYAGWIATEAQAALAFAFPLYFIQLSLCVGISQAITACIGKAVGGKQLHRAHCLMGQGIALTGIASLLLWLFALPFTHQILSYLGAENITRDYAKQYIDIIFIGAPLFIGNFALNGMLQSVGNTRAFRNSIATATVINVFLNPMLMFGWFGLPALGISGIAYATVIVQGGTVLYLLYVLTHESLARGFRPQQLIPNYTYLLTLMANAFSPTSRMLSINVGFFTITALLGYFSNDAVAGYGIALRIEQLFLLPTIGIELAMLAYASQNFGAEQFARISVAYFWCIKKGVLITAIGAAVMTLGGFYIIAFFNSDELVVRQGYYYLFLAAASGPLYVIINASAAVFLAAGRHWTLFWINILRLAIAPIILCYFFAVILELATIGIWIGLLICNVIASAFSYWYCRQILTIAKVRPPKLNNS